MIINTRKLTHTTMTMVAALGTTEMRQIENEQTQNDRLDVNYSQFVRAHSACLCEGISRASVSLCASDNGNRLLVN